MKLEACIIEDLKIECQYNVVSVTRNYSEIMIAGASGTVAAGLVSLCVDKLVEEEVVELRVSSLLEQLTNVCLQLCLLVLSNYADYLCLDRLR